MVKKKIKHVLHYLILLFLTEFIYGSRAKRKRFIGRFTIHFYSISIYSRLSWIKFKCVHFFLTPFSLFCDKNLLEWQWALSKLKSKHYLFSWAKERYDSGPKIIILGAGSVGDLLQITPVIKAISHKLPTAQICLLHRSSAAQDILQHNPYLKMIDFADFNTFDRIKRVVKKHGYADLVVEVESVSYFVSYTCAPKHLRHAELNAQMPESFFQAAESQLKHWRAANPASQVNGQFCTSKAYKNVHYLDILGITSQLPINRFSNLDFYLNSKISEDISDFFLTNPRVITIHHGVDADVMLWSRVTKMLPTKMLMATTLKDVVSLLRAEGYVVAQVGVLHDELIEGAFDFRGTTFDEAAHLLKNSHCHIGTEGGLIHLARAINTRSVVLFGPTPVDFFGYPQNINLVEGNCSGCWRATKNWFISCPIGFAPAKCMASHQAKKIVEAAIRLSMK